MAPWCVGTHRARCDIVKSIDLSSLGECAGLKWMARSLVRGLNDTATERTYVKPAQAVFSIFGA